MNTFRKIEKIESGFSRQVVLGRTLITLLETGSDDVDFLNNGQWRKWPPKYFREYIFCLRKIYHNKPNTILLSVPETVIYLVLLHHFYLKIVAYRYQIARCIFSNSSLLSFESWNFLLNWFLNNIFTHRRHQAEHSNNRKSAVVANPAFDDFAHQCRLDDAKLFLPWLWHQHGH